MASSARASTLQQGFTLIETLVVMSLLAVIMVAMGSALRTMAQTETRIDERLNRTDQMRVVNNFLRKALGRADVVKSKNANSPGGQTVQFEADTNNIRWIGIMPARYGAGGRYFFQLSSEETQQGKALVLRYSPWLMQTAFPQWSQSESYVLAPNITSFQVEAEGLPLDTQAIPPNWPRGWQQGWPVKEAVPQRVRLTWTDAKGEWPPLVIALIPTGQSQPGSGGFVIGGSAR
jgi:general secretion pathway protein J